MYKKILFGLLFIGVSVCFVACDKDNEKKDEPDIEIPDNPEDPGKDDPSETEKPAEIITNLSEFEKANCYIVTAKGKYKFAADNRFNLGEGLPVPPEINPKNARLVWQTSKDLIKSVELQETETGPFVVFEIEEALGNALIAVTDSEGNIEWSWHIWMPEQAVNSVASSTGYEVMNMNLGALNNTPGDAASYGMLYQWGRKDPFPAAATLTGDQTTVSAPLYDISGNAVTITNSDWYGLENNNIAYSISHPTVCLSNNYQAAVSRDWIASENSDDSLWGNPEGDLRDSDTNSYFNKGVKTCYDPSPAGWRVAPVDVFRHFTSSGGYAWDFADFNVNDVNNDGVINLDDYNYGWEFMINEDTPLYFPAAARFDGSYAMLMGSVSGIWGNYWSNSPSSSVNGGGMCVLAFQVKDMYGNEMITVSPAAAGSRADAYSIRCVRDK